MVGKKGREIAGGGKGGAEGRGNGSERVEGKGGYGGKKAGCKQKEIGTGAEMKEKKIVNHCSICYVSLGERGDIFSGIVSPRGHSVPCLYFSNFFFLF